MSRLSIAVLAIMLVLLSAPASSHGSSSGEVKKHHHGHHHGHHGHHGHGHGENHHHGHGHHMGSHHHGHHHHHKHEHNHEHQDEQHKDGDKPHHHDGKTRKDGKPKKHGHSDHVHYWQDDGSLDLTKVPAKALKKSFTEWKKVFGKTYETPEAESAHYATYLDNWGKIIDFNKQANQTFQMGMNQFSDLTSAQFKKYIHGGEGSCLRSSRKFWKETSSSLLSKAASAFQTIGSGGIVKANPESIDWTTKGVVTPVKNQGQCGSCWAFSTTGSLECRAAIKSGKLISLSEQQLVDCSRAEGNMGCNGGLMDDAFKYVKKEGGLCSESEYRYEGRDGVCKAATCGTKYDAITGYTDVPKDSATDLETAVVAGCVSVAIEADQSAFQFYKSGILSGRCGTRLDHGVLVVGYGEESGKKYWKVKNSWGKTWGEQGYVRICKECGKDAGRGECGILEQPSYPVV